MKPSLLLAVSLVTLTAACGKEDTCGAGYARADDGNCYPIDADGDEESDEGSDEDGGSPDSTAAGTDDAGTSDAGTTDGGTTNGTTGGGSTDGSSSGGSTDGGSSTSGSTEGGSTDGGSEAGGDPTGGIDGGEPLVCDTEADCPDGLYCDSAGFCMEGEPDADGGLIDTGEPFDITHACTGERYEGTTATGSVRDWTSFSPITFASAAWHWNSITNTAKVLVTQEEDSCGDVIGSITAKTYTGPAAYIEISDWSELGPDTLTVYPIGESGASGARISASAYYFNAVTGEGTSWPLDGFTGPPDTPVYGSLAVLYIEAGTNFEARTTLYAGESGESFDGIFNACYCDGLSALVVPAESFEGGAVEPPPGE